MQATELTSRKICKIFKDKGFNCQLNIFKASPPELATVWVHNGGMWWMIEGVWKISNQKSENYSGEIDIQFKAQILFEDRNSCELVIKRIGKLLLGVKTYLCGSKDFARTSSAAHPSYHSINSSSTRSKKASSLISFTNSSLLFATRSGAKPSKKLEINRGQHCMIVSLTPQCESPQIRTSS